MADVRAEQGHCDHVEKDDEGLEKTAAETGDDHFVGGFLGDLGEVGVRADGEMENVKNDEGEDGEAGPDHDPRGLRGLDRGLVGVFLLARGLVFPCQKDGRPNMQDEHCQKPDAGDPDQRAVTRRMEEFCVFIERLLARVDEEVSGQVTRQKKHHGQTGDGDYEFFSDGGIPISGGAASKGVHDQVRSRPLVRPPPRQLQGEEKRFFDRAGGFLKSGPYASLHALVDAVERHVVVAGGGGGNFC